MSNLTKLEVTQETNADCCERLMPGFQRPNLCDFLLDEKKVSASTKGRYHRWCRSDKREELIATAVSLFHHKGAESYTVYSFLNDIQAS